eukprot:symbB.v1.2.023513.t1/scaffold2153.1/size87802/4
MDRITAPSVTQRVTSPPNSPTSWLKTDTGPMFPKDRASAIRGERPRFDWVYDQAVSCTHDKLNGVLKTQLDVWHCPKTNGTQHILHSSSHIVDTTTRQGFSPGDFNPTEGFGDFFEVVHQAVHCTVVQQVLPGAIWTTCGYP